MRPVRFLTNVHGTSPTGGVEINVFQSCRELASRGHRPSLLHTDAGTLIPEYEQFCESLHRVRSVDWWYPDGRRNQARAAWALAPATLAAMRSRADVYYPQRAVGAAWAVAASTVTRKPIVCHLHGYIDIGPERTASLDRHVDRFVVTSQFVADPWIANGIDATKMEVVHNGIDPADYPIGDLDARRRARAELRVPDDDRLVVTYVGRLDREKGVDVLLDAWRRLDGTEAATLLVVGSPVVDHDGGAFLRELESMAAGDVRFIPLRRDVVPPLHAADVVVVPSTWDEPFGRTVIEGLATGRPVLASRVGGITEILTGPLERFLFERGDAEGLASRLRAVAGWRVDEPSLAQVCVERVTGTFTLSRMADGIERAFGAAIGGRPRRSVDQP